MTAAGMTFAVESWDPAYGSPADEAGLEPATATVDAEVEVAADRWAPIDPDPSAAPSSIVFIDGVRRIDSRVWILDGEVPRPGLCATVAAGAVRCEPGRAEIVAVEVARGLYTAADGAESIVTAGCGTYRHRPAFGDDDADLYLSIHNHMTELELALSEEWARATGGRCELLVFDGPLRHRDAAIGVGYVKTQHKQYLEGRPQRTMAALAPGQRTPLFSISADGPSPRWSWYLRLPGPVSHPWSGIVRLELPGLGEPEMAAARADAVSAALPRFASEPHKEARAPQNLYPIAGLESQLRRRLGDAHLLERALRRVAAGRPAA